ncbi:hypothetical protein [Nonomuraea sp. NPDC049158]|uniref:hypothetical protein n=1 Tax=Nonomuraea sp. NPDC049158 TaxID=3155649 RepID=UPI0033CFC15A
MTDPDATLHALLQTARLHAHEVVAQAKRSTDLWELQLSVLRTTYAPWDIDREQDTAGRFWWTAVLRQPVTLEMAAAGVLPKAGQPDAIGLAAALAWQSALLHTARLRAEPP